MANPQVVVDFIANTARLTAGMKDVTTASKAAGDANKRIGWQSVAKWAGAAVAVGAAAKFIKTSVSATEELAKSTLQVSRVTGMDMETSSQWAAVLQSRGLSAQQFSRSMVILSKQMASATDGSKKSVAAFQELGVSMSDVRAGNTQEVIMQTADALSKMENPARRAALTQQLFGRSAQQLTPLLYAGSEAIREQMAMAEHYGATLGDKSTKQVADLIAKQRELKMAFQGTQIQLGTALMPAIVTLASVLADLAHAFQPILTNANAVKAILGGLIALFIAWKAVAIAATIVDYGLAASIGAVLWPVLAVIAAIAAFIAVGVLLHKLMGDWAFVVLAVIAPWFSLIAVLILVIKHWNEVKAAVTSAMDAIKNAVLTGWSAITNAVTTAVNAVRTAAVTAWNTVRTVVTTVMTAIQTAVTTTMTAIQTVVTTAWNAIRTVITTVSSAARTAAVSAFNAMQTAISAAVHATQTAVTAAWNAIRNLVTAAANAARAAVNTLISAFNTARSAVSSLAGAIPGLTSVLHAVQSAASAVAGVFRGALAAGANAAKGALGGLAGIISGIAGAMSAAAGAANALASAIRSIPSHINLPSIPHLPHIPGFSRGGIVTRPTLAMIGEAGPEAIIPLSGGGGGGSFAGQAPVEVRVFIGSQELRGLVRSEIVQSDTGLARTLLAGARL